MAFARAGLGTTGAGAAEAFARVVDGTGFAAARAVGAGPLRGRAMPEISVFVGGAARHAHVVTGSLRP